MINQDWFGHRKMDYQVTILVKIYIDQVARNLFLSIFIIPLPYLNFINIDNSISITVHFIIIFQICKGTNILIWIMWKNNGPRITDARFHNGIIRYLLIVHRPGYAGLGNEI